MGPGAYAAVVLAGGAGRRLGGPAKPTLPVGGRSMLARVLDAVVDATARVVVGPPDLPVPVGVVAAREEPPGGGPVAGAAAGLSVVPAGIHRVALLAADLPLLDASAVALLRAAVDGDRAASPHTAVVSGAPTSGGPAPGGGPAGAAIFVDPDGRRQSLCGVWRVDALRAALVAVSARRGGLTGASMRELCREARVIDVPWTGTGAPPWFDCDTESDRRRAEEWVR